MVLIYNCSAKVRITRMGFRSASDEIIPNERFSCGGRFMPGWVGEMGSEKCDFTALNQWQEKSLKFKGICQLQGHHYKVDIYHHVKAINFLE